MSVWVMINWKRPADMGRDKYKDTQKITDIAKTKSVPIICAWCGKRYTVKKWTNDNKKTKTSHGICNKCKKQANAFLSEHLN